MATIKTAVMGFIATLIFIFIRFRIKKSFSYAEYHLGWYWISLCSMQNMLKKPDAKYAKKTC